MSDRICTITHDLSGIQIRDTTTGFEIQFNKPMDVAHAYVMERYRAKDLREIIDKAVAQTVRDIAVASTETVKILENLQRILAGT